jgi:N-acyl-D-aspartate/D-glutamate deacylase
VRTDPRCAQKSGCETGFCARYGFLRTLPGGGRPVPFAVAWRLEEGAQVHELVIRGGTVVDGTGAEPATADVAIDGGRITAVGRVSERGRRELDADGLLVTPGFVDIHTHYDGQVTWDPLLTPSAWHGVTTVVMGNCGVGFAPVRPDRHRWLIGLMEGVEDIPGTALAEGITWGWESFPEYLDAVEAVPHAVDVAAQVPHSALRAYVMGERGADGSAATAEEIAEMARLAREGVLAGALGFSTSRTVRHRAVDGRVTPSYSATADELLAIAGAVGSTGRAVFEVVSDLDDLDAECAVFREMAARTASPLSITINQHDSDPDRWRRLLDRIDAAVADGVPMKAQVAGRPIGLVLGLETSFHPLRFSPTYQAIADRPLAERVALLQEAERRDRVLDELATSGFKWEKTFPLGDPPDYEPAPETSVAAEAARRGARPEAVAYDALLAAGGHGLLYYPLFNYAQLDLEPTREMLTHPHTVLGLSDGGAHCGVICDASVPTFMLTHWGRDRSRGPRLDLAWLVRSQTRDTAAAVGLHDRGVLAPGYRADVNLIDHGALRLHRPEVVHDLPAGGRRLVQRAEGYRATVVAGEVTWQNGEHTGQLPGTLVRGPQPAPS